MTLTILAVVLSPASCCRPVRRVPPGTPNAAVRSSCVSGLQLEPTQQMKHKHYPHAYADALFWEAQYADCTSEMSGHDWYGLGAAKLWPLLRPLLPQTPVDLLELGCGSRPLLPGLRDIDSSWPQRGSNHQPSVVNRAV